MENGLTPVEMTADISDLVKRFEESEQMTRPAREKSERDRDYYDGKQWTSEEEKALKLRGQPVVTFNRIQRKVNYLKGLEAQTRKDPKAFPRNPGDDGSAQAATDALRYVCDDQDWDAKRSDLFEGMVVEGAGAVMVGAINGKQGVDPSIIGIPWDRFFFDPYSRRADFSDANYMGIVTWLDLEEAKSKFPDAKDALENTWMSAKDAQTYDDRPKNNMWSDYKRKRVRVVEMYYLKSGQWMACTFTQAGHLTPPSASPYLDEDKRPECPIKAISAYVDRDNNRYGEVRAMISPQDEVNKRRSKGLHLINSRQIRLDPASGMDASTAKRELAKPDGIISAGAGEIEILQTGDMAAANFQMLQEAKAEIDLLGPNAALAGKNENSSSGRALLAQQQGGMVEVALLMDRLRSLSLAVYRSIWARIKQYWNEERWIRVTEDERNLKWVGLNQPKTMLDVAKERLQGDPEAEFKLAMLARDPMAQQVMEVSNPVAELDVDIVIDEGIDSISVQSEQFDNLIKMAPSFTQLPPHIVEMLIMASSLRDKDKILEKFAQMQQGPQADPMQQAQQQMEAEAKVEMMKAQIKAQTDLQTAQINASVDIETAQIKAQSDAAIKANEQRIAAEQDSVAQEFQANEAAKSDALQQQLAMLGEALAGLAKPRRKVPIRDENGFITAIQEVLDDA